MAPNPTTYRGNSAAIYISTSASWANHETYAISDFSLTLDKGTVEQELIGEIGNLFMPGSMSGEGSLTSCHLYVNAVSDIITDMLTGTAVQISGSAGDNSLHFYFKSCQITGFDFSIGDADTITEGTIDFTLLYPYKVSSVTHLAGGGAKIWDFA